MVTNDCDINLYHFSESIGCKHLRADNMTCNKFKRPDSNGSMYCPFHQNGYYSDVMYGYVGFVDCRGFEIKQ